MNAGTRFSLESIKRFISQSPANLAGTIRAKIKTNNGVAIPYQGGGLSSVMYDMWLYKLVCHIPAIGIPNRRKRVRARNSLTKNHRIISAFRSLPALISVHRVVASRYSGYSGTGFVLEIGIKLFKIFESATGRRITAIHIDMGPDSLGPSLAGQSSYGNGMVLMAVNASIRHQANDMNRTTVRIGGPNRS